MIRNYIPALCSRLRRRFVNAVHGIYCARAKTALAHPELRSFVQRAVDNYTKRGNPFPIIAEARNGASRCSMDGRSSDVSREEITWKIIYERCRRNNGKRIELKK